MTSHNELGGERTRKCLTREVHEHLRCFHYRWRKKKRRQEYTAYQRAARDGRKEAWSHPRRSHGKLHVARMLRQLEEERKEREEERNRLQREEQAEQEVSDCEEEEDEYIPRYSLYCLGGKDLTQYRVPAWGFREPGEWGSKQPRSREQHEKSEGSRELEN